MIIHTPLQEHDIFDEEDDFSSYYTINVNQAMLTLKRDDSNHGYQIVHMHSTNPNDYLNKRLEPGSIYYL
ncbi:hypothetical protein ABID56_000273 [Alkalibacillus flavidus]|uniref:Uncharacterized protein n=1 Tax=Alkalibacillus flavidus TaxID=546021 RepID=A0ABV2KS54_9BACI